MVGPEPSISEAKVSGIVAPRGDLVWISDELPGSTPGLTGPYPRSHPRRCPRRRATADKGYEGACATVTSPHKRRTLSKAQKTWS
jgi:hypothetical protein